MQEDLQRLQHLAKTNLEGQQTMAGRGAQLDPAMVFQARMELMAEVMWGTIGADAESSSPERLAFELRWQEKLRDLVATGLRQSTGLIVPGRN